jgi:hypothetical protein
MATPAVQLLHCVDENWKLLSLTWLDDRQGQWGNGMEWS